MNTQRKKQSIYPFSGLPKAQGLYRPEHEHDACGIGFVANIEGQKSHDIVLKGIQILINLTHRGACGCDPQTGDGAGILIQIPHAFFERECGEPGLLAARARRVRRGHGISSGGSAGPAPVRRHHRKDRARGRSDRCSAGAIRRSTATRSGGWRATTQPYIEQIFVRRAPGMDQDALERKLYVVRKRAEAAVAETDLKEKDFFYIPSLSSRTIVYKGLLLAPQITDFYKELLDPDVTSALCLVHQRFSTNTFPSWKLAHPYRYICHNGEINTLRGNMNWMYARQSVLASPLFGDDIEEAAADHHSGRQRFGHARQCRRIADARRPHAAARDVHADSGSVGPRRRPCREDVKAFYEYHASLMEPWDGPAAVAFTDGRVIGAKLDRNGLRPGRYLVTTDGLVVMASEAGVLPVKPEEVRMKGRLAPGRMLLVDTEQKRLISDEEVKKHLAARQPYAQWLKENQITLDHLPSPDARPADGSRNDSDAAARLRLHGRGPENDSAAVRAEGRGAGRLDGNRHAAGLSCPTSRNCCSIISSRRSRRSRIRRSIRSAKTW